MPVILAGNHQTASDSEKSQLAGVAFMNGVFLAATQHLSGGGRSDSTLNTRSMLPISMSRAVDFDENDDDEDSLRQVKFVPVDESEDDW